MGKSGKTNRAEPSDLKWIDEFPGCAKRLSLKKLPCCIWLKQVFFLNLLFKNSGYLKEIIQLLISAACSHKDTLVRKSCIQVFIKHIKNWCTRPNEDEKVIYEKCGDDFLLHLAMNIFQSIQCPEDLAKKYCLELKVCDVKDLKSIYKSLVERLKMQQNGSMAFR